MGDGPHIARIEVGGSYAGFTLDGQAMTDQEAAEVLWSMLNAGDAQLTQEREARRELEEMLVATRDLNQQAAMLVHFLRIHAPGHELMIPRQTEEVRKRVAAMDTRLDVAESMFLASTPDTAALSPTAEGREEAEVSMRCKDCCQAWTPGERVERVVYSATGKAMRTDEFVESPEVLVCPHCGSRDVMGEQMPGEASGLEPCPRCGGNRWIVEDGRSILCTLCHGTGTKQEQPG